MLIPTTVRARTSHSQHSQFVRSLLLLAVTAVLAGCAARPLMPAPNVYTSGERAAFDNVPPELRGDMLEVLYVTDRAPATNEAGNATYGAQRSRSAALGVARVRMGDSVGWEAIERDARADVRPEPLDLELESFSELVRLPAVPYPFTVRDGRPVLTPEVEARLLGALQTGRTAVSERLARTPRKEVFLYVHGIKNTFDDSVFAMAELWHFLGREGVPVVFSWPSGSSGLLTGYVTDRESGEFAVFHLKRVLRELSLMEDVERVHLIAHSRGNDVALTALRELFIEAWAAGENPATVYRIHNFVAAAPDLDLEVLATRVASEHLNLGVRRVTIYTSKGDQAIGTARSLFQSSERIGGLGAGEVPEEALEITQTEGNVTVVQYTGSRGGAYGHSYFRENPAVASDIVMALRYDRDPGAENGRPLERVGVNRYRIDDAYMAGE